MDSIRLSAPGKLILMGEHAAVYARPALVAAVGLRLQVEIHRAREAGVRLDLVDLDHRQRVSWRSIHRYTQEARRRWQEHCEDPGEVAFLRVRGDDPAHVVKLALGECQSFLGEDSGPSIHLRLRSRIPVGAGFGSSAAVALAVIVGYLALRGISPEGEELDALALEVERRQHGQPSGVDGATVLRGGVLWASRRDDGRLALTPLVPRAAALAGFRVFHTGTPEQSTGEVVAAVRSRVESRRPHFEAVLDRMAEATRTLAGHLAEAVSPAADEPGSAVPLLCEELDPGAVVRCVREFEAGLEELGVVPPPVRQVIRRVEAAGGAAKISGAGALRGGRAGSLLVYHPDAEDVRRWTFLEPYPETPARLGVEGVRQEKNP